MKKIILFSFFIVSAISIEAQVKNLIVHDIIYGSIYCDDYGLNGKKLFHNQSLINFSTPEDALCSFYSNTSEAVHDKYVIKGTHTSKYFLKIYNFDKERSDYYQSLDTTSSMVLIEHKLEFNYNEERICIAKFVLFENQTGNNKLIA